MVEIDTLFHTKTAKKNIPFGTAHAYIAYIRDGVKNALQIISLEFYFLVLCFALCFGSHFESGI